VLKTGVKLEYFNIAKLSAFIAGSGLCMCTTWLYACHFVIMHLLENTTILLSFLLNYVYNNVKKYCF
jgi:hypothetical protein